MSVTKFISNKLQNLTPYQASPTLEDLALSSNRTVEEIIKLSTGENEFIKSEYVRYPDPYASKLVIALSEYVGLNPSQITIGNGSDELIDLLCAVFLDPGDTLIDLAPTFPMYRFFGQIRNAKVLDVTRKANSEIDWESLQTQSRSAKLIFVANPNNPTGTLIPTDTITQILDLDKPTVVDEAYFEYSQWTCTNLISKYDNLIVLRTFSKWAGLAGLRIGYVIANKTVIQALNAIKPPYNTNVVAQEEAYKALKNVTIKQSIQEEIRTRNWFTQELSQLKTLKVYDSNANFVYATCLDKTSSEIAKALSEKGIYVKTVENESLNGLRIGLAPKPTLSVVIEKLKEIL